jgi:hypothetical protein
MHPIEQIAPVPPRRKVMPGSVLLKRSGEVMTWHV